MINAQKSFQIDQPQIAQSKYKFARFAPRGYGYELSSKGDTRFSALFAKLQDGRSIEQAYQLDVKGFRAVSQDWRAGKGKLPINGLSADELWKNYLALWTQWASENPELIEALKVAAAGKTLTDMYASTPVSQARALAVILNRTDLAQTSSQGEAGPNETEIEPPVEAPHESRQQRMAF